jgi:hypothetical protein
MTPQVLSQDLSISHDLLGQDSQENHALAKKSSTRVDYSFSYTFLCMIECIK